MTSQLAQFPCLTCVLLVFLQIYANSDVKLEVRSPYMAKVEITRKLEDIIASLTSFINPEFTFTYATFFLYKLAYFHGYPLTYFL